MKGTFVDNIPARRSLSNCPEVGHFSHDAQFYSSKNKTISRKSWSWLLKEKLKKVSIITKLMSFYQYEVPNFHFSHYSTESNVRNQ